MEQSKASTAGIFPLFVLSGAFVYCFVFQINGITA